MTLDANQKPTEVPEWKRQGWPSETEYRKVLAIIKEDYLDREREKAEDPESIQNCPTCQMCMMLVEQVEDDKMFDLASRELDRHPDHRPKVVAAAKLRMAELSQR